MNTPKPDSIQAALAALQAKSRHPHRVKLAQTKQLLFAINQPIRNQLASIQKRASRKKVK